MTDTPALLQLMTSARMDSSTVCVSSNGQQTDWKNFVARCKHWYAALSHVPGNCIGLYNEDALEFSAALVALWQLGKHALIPGDDLPATLESIIPYVDALAGNLPGDTGKPLITPTPCSTADTVNFQNFAPDQLGVIIFTSGSTGEPKKIPVFMHQLAKEIGLHESLWGADVGDFPVLGTVSHQHFYGLIFQLLWPLTVGRPFSRKRVHYFEELSSYVQHYDRFTLISTPSHLTRIPDNLPCPQIAGRTVAAFSSTAPLSQQASFEAETKLGAPITEIFGSSETGGIAWRRQNRSELWQLLPELDAKSDPESGALLLRSPLLPSHEWMSTADRVEFTSATQFRLLGRLDRIAKVEGKRLSLTAVESSLREHKWVGAAHVAVAYNQRTELVAAIRLSESGRSALLSQGKRVLIRNLRGHLRQSLELPGIPRRWRFPEQIPVNSQGKVTQQALLSLFSDAAQEGDR